MRGTKILNSRECGFATLAIIGNLLIGVAYIKGSKFLKIKKVTVVRDDTQVFKGWISCTTYWDAEVIIETVDGKQIHVKSNEDAFFKAIEQYL